MTKALIPHWLRLRSIQWLLVILLCVSAMPLLILVPGLHGEGLSALVGLLGTLLFFLVLSLIASAIGFFTGPLTALWCLFLGAILLFVGLSNERKKFLSCSTKDQFEAALVALAPPLMFPAAVAATYMLFNRLVTEKENEPWKVAVVILVSAAIAHSGFRYFEHLERAWHLSGASNGLC